MCVPTQPVCLQCKTVPVEKSGEVCDDCLGDIPTSTTGNDVIGGIFSNPSYDD